MGGDGRTVSVGELGRGEDGGRVFASAVLSAGAGGSAASGDDVVGRGWAIVMIETKADVTVKKKVKNEKVDLSFLLFLS